jgi:predicted ester cyclase
MDKVELTRKFFKLLEMKDSEAAAKLLSDNFIFSGPVPEPIDGPAYIDMQTKLAAAFPDWSFNLGDLHLHGDEVHASVMITGTHQGDLDMSPIMMTTIPPTGKSVQLPREEITVTTNGDTISSIVNEPVMGGGVPGLLSQLGVEIPTT